MANNDSIDPNIAAWKTSGVIIPAIMTLICFICTAVSLTVSGFICLRDREAQDESNNKAKHYKEQEFISRVLGLFYKIRTSNVFRIQEIMQDLNDERPVWIGSRKDIISILEYYGIFLSEKEKSNLSATAEVHEVDSESLFYFELERFSKAQAVYGRNVLRYFESIQQDGAAFPREFYLDAKPIFCVDIIYNIVTEMQIVTELFVLLTTGIDLEIMSIYSIPPQFKHSKLGDELSKIKDFLYNYYSRVFPKERSTANVMRILPELPVIYEAIPENKKEHKIDGEIKKAGKNESYSLPIRNPVKDMATSPMKSVKRQSISSFDAPVLNLIQENQESPVFNSPFNDPAILMSPQIDLTPISSPRSNFSPAINPRNDNIAKGKRLSKRFSKGKFQVANVYKTLSDRVKQRPYSQEEETPVIQRKPPIMRRRMSDITTMRSQYKPLVPKQVHFENDTPLISQKEQLLQEPFLSEPSSSKDLSPGEELLRKAFSSKKDSPVASNTEFSSIKENPDIETGETKKRLEISEKVAEKANESKLSLEEIKYRYRAPVRRENSRRRGRLAKVVKLEHNAFTYMVTRALAYLKEKGKITEKEINTEQFRCVDKCFIV